MTKESNDMQGGEREAVEVVRRFEESCMEGGGVAPCDHGEWMEYAQHSRIVAAMDAAHIKELAQAGEQIMAQARTIQAKDAEIDMLKTERPCVHSKTHYSQRAGGERVCSDCGESMQGQTFMGEPVIEKTVAVTRDLIHKLHRAAGCSGNMTFDEVVQRALDKLTAQQVEPAMGTVTRETAEKFLVAYHAEVWQAAEDDDSRVAYDEAGRRLAKEFLSLFDASRVQQRGASVAVPEGYVLVPVDPAPDMIERAAFAESCGRPTAPRINRIYTAMLAAAPKPAAADVGGLVEALETVVQMCRNEYTIAAIQQEADDALAAYKATGGDV